MANLNNQKKIVEPTLSGKDLNIEKGNLKPELVRPIEELKPTEEIINHGSLGSFVVGRRPIEGKNFVGKVDLNWNSKELKPVFQVKDEKTAVLTFGDKFDIGLFTDKGVSILEYGFNIKDFNEIMKKEALTRDDIRELLGDLIGRGLDNDRIREQLLAQEAEKWLREKGGLRIPKANGFEVSVNTEGKGVVCSYSSWIFDPDNMMATAKHENEMFTYTLTRVDLGASNVIGRVVAKNPADQKLDSLNIKKFKIVAESTRPTVSFTIIDENVEEGQSYQYCLTVTYKKTGDKETFTKEIAYAPNPPVVESFSAYPHSTEKKVVFTSKVKNATSKEINRKDLTKSLGDVKFDANVEVGKKYEYTLIATNYWGSDKKVENVDCSNVLPNKSSVNACVDDIEKKVKLTWQSNYKVAVYTVERRVHGTSDWKNVCTENFKEISCKVIDKDASLVKGETYEYRVVNKNEWGETPSDIVKVVFDKPVPKAPRVAWTQYGSDVYFKWDYQANVQKYDLVRMNDGKSLNTDAYLCRATDYSLVYGTQYTYEIIAKNEWGLSVPSYCDVKIENPDMSGKKLLDCYEQRKHYVDAEDDDSNYDWAQDFQGITLDGNYWYFTNGSEYGVMSKFPINQSIKKDITSAIDESRTFTSHDIHYTIGYSVSTLSNQEKSYRARCFYCNNYHFGDCDFYKGLIFVPAYPQRTQAFYYSSIFLYIYTQIPNYFTINNIPEKAKKEIWIFDAETLKLLHREEIKKKDNMLFDSLGWCAVNPCDGKLYTCDHTLEGSYTEDGSPLIRFKIHLENIGTTKPVFERDGDIKVYRQNGVEMNGKECMQGGCFDCYNNIYLNSGYYDWRRPMEGIQVFKLVRDDSKQFDKAVEEAAYYKWLNKGKPNQNAMEQKYDYQEAFVDIKEAYDSRDLKLDFDCAKAVMISMSDNDKKPFRYNVAHGLPIAGTSVYAEEPEGLAYYDLTGRSDLPSESMKCSLHVSLLDNDLSEDQIYIMEYSHLFRETSGRTIYYHPSNLIVKKDENRNDYKLVDNCILVQRFSKKEEAESACKLFSEWGRNSNGQFNYHVIGDLYTCSPEHNYEFKFWNGAMATSSESAYLLFEYNKNGCLSPVYERERWVVTVKSKDGKKQKTFYAHNQGDADSICSYIRGFSKMYMIGSSTINDERNFIWFR